MEMIWRGQIVEVRGRLMTDHVHEWRAEGVYFGPWAVCDCDKTLTLEEVQCRLNATDWMYRMGNEDIAAELSASWDLPLHITRGIADWILKDG